VAVPFRGLRYVEESSSQWKMMTFREVTRLDSVAVGESRPGSNSPASGSKLVSYWLLSPFQNRCRDREALPIPSAFVRSFEDLAATHPSRGKDTRNISSLTRPDRKLQLRCHRQNWIAPVVAALSLGIASSSETTSTLVPG